jgi:hypothetical protein
MMALTMMRDRKANRSTADIERRRRTVSDTVQASAAAPRRTLQERLGNHAAKRFAARLQRKPSVSAPHDPLERQADSVAE